MKNTKNITLSEQFQNPIDKNLLDHFYNPQLI